MVDIVQEKLFQWVRRKKNKREVSFERLKLFWTNSVVYAFTRIISHFWVKFLNLRPQVAMTPTSTLVSPKTPSWFTWPKIWIQISLPKVFHPHPLFTFIPKSFTHLTIITPMSPPTHNPTPLSLDFTFIFQLSDNAWMEVRWKF